MDVTKILQNDIRQLQNLSEVAIEVEDFESADLLQTQIAAIETTRCSLLSSCGVIEVVETPTSPLGSAFSFLSSPAVSHNSDVPSEIDGVPSLQRGSDDTERQKRIQELESQLEAAVEQNNFELADRLNEEIQILQPK
jgi:protein-arginine kinase activator protein McsA